MKVRQKSTTISPSGRPLVYGRLEKEEKQELEGNQEKENGTLLCWYDQLIVLYDIIIHTNVRSILY